MRTFNRFLVAASLATAVVTPTPERAQIATMPLVFVMLSGAVLLAAIPPGSGGRPWSCCPAPRSGSSPGSR
jgi:hypothetical protein